MDPSHIYKFYYFDLSILENDSYLYKFWGFFTGFIM